jgi:hypothetical protein
MNTSKLETRSIPVACTASWWVRALLVAMGLVVWFWTQSLIGQRAISGQTIGDELHVLTAPAHQYLLDHPRAANGLLIASSAVIDLFAIFLLGRAIFGPTFRPFIGLLMLFALRQICQALCALPPPEEMIWRNPGFPSLVVTYGVANDLFFFPGTRPSPCSARSNWRALAGAGWASSASASPCSRWQRS